MTPFREAQGKLLVEAVEASNVRQDGNADPARFVLGGGKGGKAGSVRCLQDETSCDTAAPRMAGMGGEEARSKHTAATIARPRGE